MCGRGRRPPLFLELVNQSILIVRAHRGYFVFCVVIFKENLTQIDVFNDKFDIFSENVDVSNDNYDNISLDLIFLLTILTFLIQIVSFLITILTIQVYI